MAKITLHGGPCDGKEVELDANVVGTELVLRDVITELHGAWMVEQVRAVITHSSPATALRDITDSSAFLDTGVSGRA